MFVYNKNDFVILDEILAAIVISLVSIPALNVWCIYLDFAKAFNKVHHQGLLIKLRAVGSNGVDCLVAERQENSK